MKHSRVRSQSHCGTMVVLEAFECISSRAPFIPQPDVLLSESTQTRGMCCCPKANAAVGFKLANVLGTLHCAEPSRHQSASAHAGPNPAA